MQVRHLLVTTATAMVRTKYENCKLGAYVATTATGKQERQWCRSDTCVATSAAAANFNNWLERKMKNTIV